MDFGPSHLGNNIQHVLAFGGPVATIIISIIIIDRLTVNVYVYVAKGFVFSKQPDENNIIFLLGSSQV